jgi:hypothetical protein
LIPGVEQKAAEQAGKDRAAQGELVIGRHGGANHCADSEDRNDQNTSAIKIAQRPSAMLHRC